MNVALVASLQISLLVAMTRRTWVFLPSIWLQIGRNLLEAGTIMTIAKDRVKPSPLPDSWRLSEIFATGAVLGAYLAVMTNIFFWLLHDTTFFQVHHFTLLILFFNISIATYF